MKALWLTLLCLLPLTAVADVYEWVDKDGRTHYSDTPRPGAKRIPLPDFQPVPPPPSLEGTFPDNPGADAPAPVLTALRVVKPGEGETVFDNSGSVTVEWVTEPSAAGIRYQVRLDGQAQPALQSGRSLVLQGVERGEHTVQVSAVDPDGRPLAESKPVTFYLRRASRL
ncbi:MAG: DUF4124 domain-containing protein [Sulfuricellaceae bacterium]|jgi:hypothetical protein